MNQGMAISKNGEATKPKQPLKKGRWRVYGVRRPMDFEGKPFRPQGRAKSSDGWFWIGRSDQIQLYVRVHGLEAARAICEQLNRGSHGSTRNAKSGAGK